MARTFVAASSQYLEADVALVAAEPVTMACWFNSDDVTIRQSLMWVGDKDVVTEYHDLTCDGATAGDPVRAGSENAGRSSTTTGYSANTWHHAAGVWVNDSERSSYIDGGSKGTNSTLRTVTGLDRTSIGRYGDSSPSDYMSGLIAEAALWTVALSDAEILVLALGVSPLLVQPGSLAGYWPLLGRVSPEIDYFGGTDLTVTGATVGDHPRMRYGNVPLSFKFKSVVPTTVSGEVALRAQATLAADAGAVRFAIAALTALATLGADPGAVRAAEAGLRSLATLGVEGATLRGAFAGLLAQAIFAVEGRNSTVNAEMALRALATLGADATVRRGAEAALTALAQLQATGRVQNQLGVVGLVAQATLAATGRSSSSIAVALWTALGGATGGWTAISEAVSGLAFPYNFPIVFASDLLVGGWDARALATGGWTADTKEVGS